MKLNHFNKANMSHQRPKESTVRFGRKSANVISDEAAEAIGLGKGMKVSFVQDEENPEDWYMLIDIENGFELRQGKNDKHLSFNCAALSNTFLDAVGLENAHSATFKLITEPNIIEGGGEAIPGNSYQSFVNYGVC